MLFIEIHWLPWEKFSFQTLLSTFLKRALCQTIFKTTKTVRSEKVFKSRWRNFSTKVNKIAIYVLYSGSKECHLIYFNKFHLKFQNENKREADKSHKRIITNWDFSPKKKHKLRLQSLRSQRDVSGHKQMCLSETSNELWYEFY
jgi:hypothetical protein